MSVGRLRSEAQRRSSQSNSPTRRLRLVVVVRSCVLSRRASRPDLLETSVQLISPFIGPDGPPTLIGYVRQTIRIFRTDPRGMPASERHPVEVVSRDVTCG